MNATVEQRFGYGIEKWSTASEITDTSKKLPIYTELSGVFARVLETKELPPSWLGLISFFYYDYITLLAGAEAFRLANDNARIMLQVCDRVLALDSSELFARFTLLCDAADRMPKKPDLGKNLSDLIKGSKPAWRVAFTSSRDQTEYNIMKGKLETAFKNLVNSYRASYLSRKLRIETYLQVSYKVLNVSEIPEQEFGINTLPLLEAIVDGPNHLENFQHGAETEEEMEAIFQDLETLLNATFGIVTAKKASRR